MRSRTAEFGDLMRKKGYSCHPRCSEDINRNEICAFQLVFPYVAILKNPISDSRSSGMLQRATSKSHLQAIILIERYQLNYSSPDALSMIVWSISKSVGRRLTRTFLGCSGEGLILTFFTISWVPTSPSRCLNGA
jgi:hypothetical protein